MEEEAPEAPEAPSRGPGVEEEEIVPPVIESVPSVVRPDLADVFFDYDRYTIRPEEIRVLERNAEELKSTDKAWSLLITGHCDERGTSDYNLVLGERRAQAAKRYLVNLGVPASQIAIISYGKEKPFCLDHSQRCWQLNRRAHFVVKQSGYPVQ